MRCRVKGRVCDVHVCTSTHIHTCNVLGSCCFCCTARAAMRKHHRWGLTQQKYIHSHFWMLRVQNQSAGRVGSFGGLRGNVCSQPVFSACRQRSSPRLLTSYVLCACLCVQVSPFFKDTSHTGSEPTLNLISP